MQIPVLASRQIPGSRHPTRADPLRTPFPGGESRSSLNGMTDSSDATRPAQIAALVESGRVAKAALRWPQMLTLAMLAGAFIGFGAAAYTMVMTGVDPGFGPSRLLGGQTFSLGLILVIVGGAELFTGNALMVMAAVDRRITRRSVAAELVDGLSGQPDRLHRLGRRLRHPGPLGRPDGGNRDEAAATKADLPTLQALFSRGILCNALVCLAVWLTFAARSATGKILAIIWPISAFVLLGLEHSVANMYLFPQALAAGADIAAGAMLHNLFWVTLGNHRRSGGVALAYRFAYLPAPPD